MSKKYSKAILRQALTDIDNGVPVSTTSKKYGIPRTTLIYKKSGKYPRECRKGPATNLTANEEDLLVKWLFYISDSGFPATKHQLIDSVELIFKLNKRENNFKNGRPGKKWYSCFLQRHPEVAHRVTQNLSTGRSSVTEEILRSWFRDIKFYLEENNYSDIFKNAQRVFNADESAFYMNPKGSRVLTRKGASTVYSHIPNDEKECLTVLMTANAAGTVAPGMILFAHERIPPAISISMPKCFAIGKSENGWMTAETFYEYFTNVFYPWAVETKIEFPIIFFVDGHSSHVTWPLSNFCNEKNIILITLLPNSTHITQPLDVAVFRSLKNCWKKEVNNWRMENNGAKMKKENFGPVLEKAIKNSVTPQILSNGFRATGLCPFDVDAINYQKYFKSNNNVSINQAMPINETIQEQTFQQKLETYIEPVVLENFNAAYLDGTWNGDVEHLSLFRIWLKVKNEQSNSFVDPESIHLEILAEDQFGNHSEDKQNSMFKDDNTDKDQPIIFNVNNSMPGSSDVDVAHCDNIQNAPVEQVRLNECTPEKYGQFNEKIPTPFKKALFWPQQPSTKNVKRRISEKVPSVATSIQWKEYHLKKMAEKQCKELEKEERKRKREEKKMMNKNKKRKSPKENSDTETSECDEQLNLDSDSADDDINDKIPTFDKSNLKVGDYVIVIYEEQHYPGKIKLVEENKAFISVMVNSNFNTWKWPNKEDTIWYDHVDILEKINEPTSVNNRGIYKVPEIMKFSCFY